MKYSKLLNFRFLCLITVILSTISCSSDDGPTGGGDDGDKKEAIVAVLRKSTPSGRVYYVGAFDKVPKEMKSEDMIEAGGFVVPFTYKNNLYTWNATDGTFTKYNVSSSLKIDKGGVINLNSYGIQSESVMPAFLSEKKAYLISLVKGMIFEFNPETMKITKKIEVPALPGANDPNIKNNTYEAYVRGSKVLIPVTSQTEDFNSIPTNALMGVFDMNTETVSYVKDDRMMIGYYRFTENRDGTLYYRPSKNTVLCKEYADPSVSKNFPSPGVLLKVNANGTFDSNFKVDVDKILQRDLKGHYTTSVVYIYDDYALVQYLNETYEKPADPSNWWKLKSNEYALIDMKKKTAVKYNPFGDLGTLFYVGTVNGVPYYGNFGAKDKKYSIIKQTGVKDFEVVGESVGGVFLYIDKLTLK